MKKKFWVHYSKNNTPKRRSMELTPLAELLPRMNIKCETPLWYIKGEKEHGCNWVDYYIYAQLSDTVAIDTTFHLTDFNIEDMQKDEQNRYYENMNLLSDFTKLLLSGQYNWMPEFALKAYEEINSPLLSTFQAMRKMFVQLREAEHEKYKAEQRKQEEEEKQRKIEAEKKEQERLTGEAKKFKDGAFIKGEDVVELCRRYGIKVHLRTVHNLQQVVNTICGKSPSLDYHYQCGTRTPKFDGCYKAAKELYAYLQTHDNLEAA